MSWSFGKGEEMSGIDSMKKRMSFYRGETSDGRFTDNKYRSFLSSLKDSYQAEWITFKDKTYRCLINPDKLKTDYDQKEISIDFEAGMQNGDTFYWDRTGTHWMAYLQRLEEEAYFRAEIRRCNYQIHVGENDYWVYLRGPVETAIVWRQKHKIEMNDLNYSIMFYIQKNEETMEELGRLKVLKFEGHNWRVATTDKYSQPGLIEVYLEEFNDNAAEDVRVETELKYAEEHPQVVSQIVGPSIVRPYDTKVSYSIENQTAGKFVVNSTKVKINQTDVNSCELDILTGKAGEFILSYINDDNDEFTLEVKIKSL